MKVKLAMTLPYLLKKIRKNLIKKKGHEYAYISNVLCVLTIKNNHIILGQLLEKKYSMKLEDGWLLVYDAKKKIGFESTFN